MSDQLVLHFLAPQPPLRQVFEQMRIDDLELSGEDPAGVDVTGVGFDGLVVAQDLGGGGRGHGGNQQAVPEAVLGNVGLEGSPVMEVCRGDVPHIVLQDLQQAIKRLGASPQCKT